MEENIASKEAEKETLKKEILVELERQALKNEILKEIRPANWKTVLARFTQHPAFLLLISFALTGVIGFLLTSSWQRREWDRQQSRLVQIKGIDQKYGIIDEITKVVGENNSDILDIVPSIFAGTAKPEDIEKKAANWEQGSKRWSVARSILQQELKIYFRDPEIHSIFNNMNGTRTEINRAVKNLLDDYKALNGQHDYKYKLNPEMRRIIFLLDMDSDTLKQLIDKMTNEIREDVKGTR